MGEWLTLPERANKQGGRWLQAQHRVRLRGVARVECSRYVAASGTNRPQTGRLTPFPSNGGAASRSLPGYAALYPGGSDGAFCIIWMLTSLFAPKPDPWARRRDRSEVTTAGDEAFVGGDRR